MQEQLDFLDDADRPRWHKPFLLPVTVQRTRLVAHWLRHMILEEARHGANTTHEVTPKDRYVSVKVVDADA